MSDETIETICSVLPVNEEWLRAGNGEMTNQAAVDMENIGNRIKNVFFALHKIRQDVNRPSQCKFPMPGKLFFVDLFCSFFEPCESKGEKQTRKRSFRSLKEHGTGWQDTDWWAETSRYSDYSRT